MSSESDEEDRNNFFQLRMLFEKDCTQLLRKVLENYFSNCANLLEKIPKEAYATENGIISDKNEKLLKRDNINFKRFNLDLLCVIFQTGVCDEFCGRPQCGWQPMEKNFISNPQNTGDDILRLMQIWRQHLENNEEEEMTINNSNMIWKMLYDVACRLSNTFPSDGKRFLKKIEKGTSGNVALCLFTLYHIWLII